jgi:hypothetical protein
VDLINPPKTGDLGRGDVVCSGEEHATNSRSDGYPQAKITLLPYQTDICARLNASIAAGQGRMLLVVRTAGRKTIVAVEMIRQAIARGEEVLVIVHTNELVAQTSHKLIDFGLGDRGFIKARRPRRLLAPIQVASVQTLHARVFRSKKIELRKFGHDPGGLQISDFLRWNMADLEKAVGWSPENLTIDRLGLNADFINDNGLTWIDNLETSKGGRLDDPRHPDHRKAYVQDYLARFGARKCEANALVVRPPAGRDLLHRAILKYLPYDLPYESKGQFNAKVSAVRNELKIAIGQRLGVGQ